MQTCALNQRLRQLGQTVGRAVQDMAPILVLRVLRCWKMRTELLSLVDAFAITVRPARSRCLCYHLAASDCVCICCLVAASPIASFEFASMPAIRIYAAILSLLLSTPSPGPSLGCADLGDDAGRGYVVQMHVLQTLVVRCCRFVFQHGNMHQPGIEPGSHRWQRCILPLDH